MAEKFPGSDEETASMSADAFDFDEWLQDQDEQEAFLRRQAREEAFLNSKPIMIFGVNCDGRLT